MLCGREDIKCHDIAIYREARRLPRDAEVLSPQRLCGGAFDRDYAAHRALTPALPGCCLPLRRPPAVPFSPGILSLASMSSTLAAYESFLVKNVSTISSLESTLRSITWILPGRFRDAELASEAC